MRTTPRPFAQQQICLQGYSTITATIDGRPRGPDGPLGCFNRQATSLSQFIGSRCTSLWTGEVYMLIWHWGRFDAFFGIMSIIPVPTDAKLLHRQIATNARRDAPIAYLISALCMQRILIG